MKTIGKFLFNLLYLIDLALNTLLLGDPSETVSSRLGRAKRSGRPARFATFLSIIVDRAFKILIGDQDHSNDSIEYDEDFEHEIWSWIKKEQK